MAKAGMSIGLDSDAKRHIQRLTTAIDALAKAINSGEKVDKDSISEPVVQRLVEDVRGPKYAQGGYVGSGTNWLRDWGVRVNPDGRVVPDGRSIGQQDASKRSIVKSASEFHEAATSYGVKSVTIFAPGINSAFADVLAGKSKSENWPYQIILEYPDGVLV